MASIERASRSSGPTADLGSGSSREVAHPVEFYRQGNEVYGHRFELEVPLVGNVETRPKFLR